MTKKLVKVTMEDISNGKRCTSTRCPVSIAISNTIGVPIGVGIKEWGRSGRGGGSYPLPKSAIDFIRQFDMEDFPYKPFSFYISY